MFSLWRSIISGPPIIVYARYSQWAIPMNARVGIVIIAEDTAKRDPRDTYLVINTDGIKTATAATVETGANIVSAPTADAMPLPP